jgi:hydroxymethylglutaryl-CoA reductase (NADPH)
VIIANVLQHAETLDIIIMVLGYISMHLTFVSLFLAMRRLGSNFWLATSVLFSSIFAFLFGLIMTTKLGVPINMVLLSEGLPFLVVTIGFEKSIILTKAVLTASLDSRRPSPRESVASGHAGNGSGSLGSPTSIQYAIQVAVKDKGFEIVRDYCIEIAILIAGAASGVQGGLRQFCFLAAWILFFDCFLLFTFYTTILCIKLEINRIKRHIALRKALEEDGMSRRVAENVASRNDWPRGESDIGDSTPISKHSEPAVFGKKVRASSVPKFKILMVSGFVLVNVLNLCTIPFRNSNKSAILPKVPGLSNALSPTPIDPFKVAEKALDSIFLSAKEKSIDTIVTILPPIKYELEYPSRHTADTDDNGGIFDIEYTDHILDAVGGKVIESLLKSFEDPVLSKWIVVALTMSLILNGYLFNAARWSIKDPQTGPSIVEVKEPQVPAPRNAVEPDRTPVMNGRVHDTTPSPPDMSLQDGCTPRTKAECEQMLKEKKAPQLTDEELIDLSLRGKFPGYALEKTMEDPSNMTRLASFTRAVKLRRSIVSRTPATSATTQLLETSKVPYKNFNYTLVHGACCENVIGYLPLPLGVAGPLKIDGQNYFLPMATTEGVLVASTSRGCKAINAGGGAVTVVTGDGMTRGPCISFPTLVRAGAAKVWLDSLEGQRVMTKAFNSTSRFARLQSMKTALAGTYLYIRFKTTTGDAMGMNMISKGVEYALHVMSTESGFDDMSIISLSGNFCTDKKPAAVNWIDGRGKAVVAEAIIPGNVVRDVLKSDVNAIVELNTAKNLIGSAMAGSIGGFNAHASNIVTAIFIATGQDPAQNVESSNCITIMKK